MNFITFLQFHYLKIKYFKKIFNLTIKYCKMCENYSNKNVIFITNCVKNDFYCDEEVVNYISKLNEIRKKYCIPDINLSGIILYNHKIVL